MATCKRLPTWVKYSRPSNPFAKRHYPQVGIAVSDVAATTQWSTLRAYLQILALLPLAIVQLHEILLFSLFPSFFFFHALQRCASSLPRFSSPLPPLRPLRRRRSTCVRTLVGRPSPQRSAPSSRTLFSAAQCSVNARTLTAPSPPPPQPTRASSASSPLTSCPRPQRATQPSPRLSSGLSRRLTRPRSTSLRSARCTRRHSRRASQRLARPSFTRCALGGKHHRAHAVCLGAARMVLTAGSRATLLRTLVWSPPPLSCHGLLPRSRSAGPMASRPSSPSSQCQRVARMSVLRYSVTSVLQTTSA